MQPHSFRDSHIIFATNHGKVVAAREPFEDILGAKVEELPIDSDSLGTFSGEIARPGSMLDALRGKIKLAQKHTDAALILASEGSFSSADGFGLLVHSIEMLMLTDTRTGVEIVEQRISYQTNYATATLRSLSDLHDSLKRIHFGTHALVLYPEGLPLVGNVQKGITEMGEAERSFHLCASRSPSQSVMGMSDMRAHLNPTRMKEIRACCELLAKRLSTACPRCGSGGFGLTATVPGLPCSECGTPTQRARGEIHSCPFCGEQRELPRSDGKTFALASECEWCNP
jgi:hypothetical protein